jgi:hypothetical protein
MVRNCANAEEQIAAEKAERDSAIARACAEADQRLAAAKTDPRKR